MYTYASILVSPWKAASAKQHLLPILRYGVCEITHFQKPQHRGPLVWKTWTVTNELVCVKSHHQSPRYGGSQCCLPRDAREVSVSLTQLLLGAQLSGAEAAQWHGGTRELPLCCQVRSDPVGTGAGHGLRPALALCRENVSPNSGSRAELSFQLLSLSYYKPLADPLSIGLT